MIFFKKLDDSEKVLVKDTTVIKILFSVKHGSQNKCKLSSVKM